MMEVCKEEAVNTQQEEVQGDATSGSDDSSKTQGGDSGGIEVETPLQRAEKSFVAVMNSLSADDDILRFIKYMEDTLMREHKVSIFGTTHNQSLEQCWW